MLNLASDHPPNRLRHFLECVRGSIHLMTAVWLVILFGCMGTAIDYGIWVDRRFELQAMADKAALTGALALAEIGEDSATERALLSIAEHGGTANKPDIEVLPAEGKVRVRLTEHGPRYFSGFYLDRDPTIGVVAEATASKGKGRMCALALDELGNPGIHMNGDGVLTGPECIMWTNSRTGNALKLEKNVSAVMKRICAAGGASNSSKGIVSPQPERGCDIQPDPFESFTMMVPAGCDYTKFSSNEPIVTLVPGTYCDGITISSDKVIAQPGVYHVKDGIIAISGTSDVVFENATVYLSGEKVGITIKGDSSLRIVAPTSGPTADIAMAMDPSATPAKESSFAGSSRIYISGTLHLPKEKIKISGDSVGVAELDNAMLIGSKIEFGGGAAWTWKAVDRLPEAEGDYDLSLTK